MSGDCFDTCQGHSDDSYPDVHRHPPVRQAAPAEPPGELREQVAIGLASHRLVTPRQCFCGEREPFEDGMHRPEWHVAHLLSGPLAPLLAKIRAVESVLDEAEQVMEPGGIALVVTARVRRALGGPR